MAKKTLTTRHRGLIGPTIDAGKRLGEEPLRDVGRRKLIGEWKPGTGIAVTPGSPSERIAKKAAQGKVAGIRGFVRRNFSNPNIIDLAPVGEFHKAQQAADERSLRKRGVRYKGGKA